MMDYCNKQPIKLHTLKNTVPKTKKQKILIHNLSFKKSCSRYRGFHGQKYRREKIERAAKKNTVCHLYRRKVISIKEKIEEYWNEDNQFKVIIQHIGSINDLVHKKPEKVAKKGGPNQI